MFGVYYDYETWTIAKENYRSLRNGYGKMSKIKWIEWITNEVVLTRIMENRKPWYGIYHGKKRQNHRIIYSARW